MAKELQLGLKNGVSDGIGRPSIPGQASLVWMGVMSAMLVGVEVWWMVRLTLCAWIYVTLGTAGLGLISSGFEGNVLLKRRCMSTDIESLTAQSQLPFQC